MKHFIKTNVVNVALGLSLLGAGCATSQEQNTLQDTEAKRLSIVSHVAEAAGFHVNSHLIYGEREAVLVDAQFTRSEATELAKEIKDLGKELTTVFITHGHPDHYFGVEVLKKAFPKARFVASAETIQDIKATGAAKLAQWKPIYKNDLTDTVPVIEELVGGLTVDDIELEVIELAAGESEHAQVVYVPQLQTVIAGDALFDEVHFWLAEGRLDGVRENFEALKKISNAKFFLAGHSQKARTGTSELIERNEGYVATVERELDLAADAKELADKVKAKYPTYALPIIAEISAQTLKPAASSSQK